MESRVKYEKGSRESREKETPEKMEVVPRLA